MEKVTISQQNKSHVYNTKYGKNLTSCHESFSHGCDIISVKCLQRLGDDWVLMSLLNMLGVNEAL